MKQTTLFDNKVELIKRKPKVIENKETNEEKILKPIVYKPTENDFDKLEGFDETQTNWIYPINLPVRDYQLEIVNQCLYKNTMVCLPTGLGKTFISTVVLYNFYRWYPNSKLVFVAPTKPLVKQQMTSCKEVVPIDKNEIIEMTGSIHQTVRKNLWLYKRVFFLTAQVFNNDLINGICPGKLVKLVVMDEAHKATGNHAYCEVIRNLTGEANNNRQFRILGLSATPGNDLETIQDVLQNLLIAHIELRTDECPDIQKYSHERQIETIKIPLSPEIRQARDDIYMIFQPMFERLIQFGAIPQSSTKSSLSKFGLLQSKERYKSNNRMTINTRVMHDFATAITLYHAVDLVQQHGLYPLYTYLGNCQCNSSTMPHMFELMSNPLFNKLYDSLKKKFNSDTFVGGHPKLEKLEQLVKQHFQQHDQPFESKGQLVSRTRVIIFSEFRDSVDEIYKILNQFRPQIRPVKFMGGKSIPGAKMQKSLQIESVRAFSAGTANVLVSTCIGEEGIDIGEVDLIVCFDSTRSPIRLVQRSGRTGRKRQGRIVMLLSEGKEVQNYYASMRKKSKIHSSIFEGYKHLKFYPSNPRMIPLKLQPKVSYINFDISKKSSTQSNKVSMKRVRNSAKQKTLEQYLDSMTQQPQLAQIVKRKLPGSSFVNFERFQNAPMLSLGENSNDTRFTLTLKFNTVKQRSSLYKISKTTDRFCSEQTKKFVGILRLKEANRLGDIRLSIPNIMNAASIYEVLAEDYCSEHSYSSFSLSSLSQTSENNAFNKQLKELYESKPDLVESVNHWLKQGSDPSNSDTNDNKTNDDEDFDFSDEDFDEEVFNDSSFIPSKDPSSSSPLVNSFEPSTLSKDHSSTVKPFEPFIPSKDHSSSIPLVNSFEPYSLSKDSSNKAANVFKPLETSSPIRNKNNCDSFLNESLFSNTSINDSIFKSPKPPTTNSFLLNRFKTPNLSRDASSNSNIKGLLSKFNRSSIDNLDVCESGTSSIPPKINLNLDVSSDLFSDIDSSFCHSFLGDKSQSVCSKVQTIKDMPLKQRQQIEFDLGDDDLFVDCDMDFSTMEESGDKQKLSSASPSYSPEIVGSPSFNISSSIEDNDENNGSTHENTEQCSPSFLDFKILRNQDIVKELDLHGTRENKPYEIDDNKVTVCGKKKSKSKQSGARAFFLTQADATQYDDDDDEDEEDSNRYEDSFIDDSVEDYNSTHNYSMYAKSLMNKQANIDLIPKSNQEVMECSDCYEYDSFVVPDNYVDREPRRKHRRLQAISDNDDDDSENRSNDKLSCNTKKPQNTFKRLRNDV